MEILQYSFMQKALVSGLFLFIITGFVSFFVVNKDLSFIGTGIAHIAFGGIALGILIGVPPFLSGAVFCLLTAMGIAAFSFNKKISANVFIGIFLSFSMALGILFIKMKQNANIDIFSYLFGSILGINILDLILFGAITLIMIFFFLLYMKKFLLMIFDSTYGQAIKEPIKFFHYTLIICIAIAVILMVKIVGIIMVEGLLILPAISAYHISKNYWQQLFYSLIFSFVSIFGGLFISASALKVPPGPSIIVIAFIIFLVTLIFKKR